MFLQITDARHVESHRVQLAFSDGTKAEIDLKDSLDGPIFEPLRDVDYFKSFSIVGHMLAWPNGADFAPEYLRSIASTPAGTRHSRLDLKATPTKMPLVRVYITRPYGGFARLGGQIGTDSVARCLTAIVSHASLRAVASRLDGKTTPRTSRESER